MQRLIKQKQTKISKHVIYLSTKSFDKSSAGHQQTELNHIELNHISAEPNHIGSLVNRIATCLTILFSIVSNCLKEGDSNLYIRDTSLSALYLRHYSWLKL